MEFKKISKIEAYRFYISDCVYCQCECDLNESDEKVKVLYTIGNTDTSFSQQAALLYYSREDILNSITSIMEQEINKFLIHEATWKEVIPDIFYNKKDFYLFAAEYEPEEFESRF